MSQISFLLLFAEREITNVEAVMVLAICYDEELEGQYHKPEGMQYHNASKQTGKIFIQLYSVVLHSLNGVGELLLAN